MHGVPVKKIDLFEIQIALNRNTRLYMFILIFGLEKVLFKCLL